MINEVGSRSVVVFNVLVADWYVSPRHVFLLVYFCKKTIWSPQWLEAALFQ